MLVQGFDGAGFDMHVIVLCCILLVSILVRRHYAHDSGRTELQIATLASAVPY